MPGFKNTLVRTTGNPNMIALGCEHDTRLRHMVLPQLPDYEGLNAGTYDPYNNAGGRVWKEKMHRHNGGKIKDLIANTAMGWAWDNRS